jgi:SNF2 family DNA or RNA helicase
MGTKAARAAIDALAIHPGPAILTMNCEAITTNDGEYALRAILRNRKTMLVVDEDWATRWSARTKMLLRLGRAPNVKMRRLLTGTPADEGPDNLYFPTNFLRPGALGFTTATAFRARYTKYEEEEIAPGVFTRKKGYNRRTNTHFDVKIGYQNLEELFARLSTFSDRVRREGSNKEYATRYFTMTPKQQKVYDGLRDQYVAELGDGDVPVANVLTRMTRLQMVARGYFPPERTGTPCTNCETAGFLDDGTECPQCDGLGMTVAQTELQRIDTHNPALETLVSEVERTRKPFLVWCRFRQDVTDVTVALTKAQFKVGRYDGSMPRDTREGYYHAFKDGQLDGLIATEKSGLGRGHDCSRARLSIYYSNEFSLRERRQTEDRTESMDQDAWTDVVDLVAEGTRDLDVIEALRAKRSIAELIVGDPPSRWL